MAQGMPPSGRSMEALSNLQSMCIDGILELVLPKVEKSKRRKFDVR